MVTHRDPAHVVTSLATMVSYVERMFCSAPLDPHGDGPALGRPARRRCSTRCSATATSSGRTRRSTCRSTTFIADQEGALERVLALAGEEFTPDARAGVAGVPRRVTRAATSARIDYRPESVGLDPDALRTRFAPYSARFLGPDWLRTSRTCSSLTETRPGRALPGGTTDDAGTPAGRHDPAALEP